MSLPFLPINQPLQTSKRSHFSRPLKVLIYILSRIVSSSPSSPSFFHHPRSSPFIRMPRKSNQTQYDDMMSVFRQDGDRRSSHRRDTNAPVQAAVPRSRTPHPTRDPVIAPATYGYPVQPQVPASSGGGVSPQGWDELYGSTYPGASVQDTPHSTNIYGNIPSYGQTSAIVNPATSSQTPYNTPSQWIVQFNYDSGREPRQVAVPIQRHQVPELQCLCGTHIRIVHLPTLVNWIPPFGVLWNFKLNDRNGWLEGNNTNACISATGCPRCKAYITLHGPTTGGTS